MAEGKGRLAAWAGVAWVAAALAGYYTQSWGYYGEKVAVFLRFFGG